MLYEGSFAYQFGRAMDIYQQLNEQPEAVRLTLDEDPSAPSVDTKPRDMYIGFALRCRRECVGDSASAARTTRSLVDSSQKYRSIQTSGIFCCRSS